MVFHGWNADRLERPQSHMQSQLSDLNSTLSKPGQDFGREVQSRRGGRHRSTLASVDRLVALLVSRSVFAGNVGWKRYVSQRLDGSKEVRHRRESNAPFAEAA